jgi:N-acetyl-gamma-glutamyl-phosphate reductase
MIKVGVVGGTGYTGVELLRLLAQHPHVELKVVTSRSDAGTPVAQMFPNLRGYVDIAFSVPDVKTLSECDMVFFATPNGTAMQSVPELLKNNVKVIDLAADFRLKNPQTWEQWYKMPHACPELLDEAVYGLPEINRNKIKGSRLVANPGCYPTAVQLGFLPLLEKNLIETEGLIADVKSGVSGAGRKAEIGTLLAEAGDNFKAYNIQGHRHFPEIVQGLNQVSVQPIDFTFVPHLTPMIRGIHATLYAKLTQDIDLHEVFANRYQNEPFVDVLPFGSHPDTRSVRGSNLCRISVHRPQNGKRVVITSVIDNLVKGAAGQAIQNMNLLFNFPETTGLQQIALLP